MNIDKEKLIYKKNTIANLIESNKKGTIPTELEILDNLKRGCTLLYPDMPIEERNEIKKMLLEQFQFKMERGVILCNEENSHWFTDIKPDNNNYYFDRYKEYLFNDRGFNQESIRVMDCEVLDEIMNYLGNPKGNFEPKRGLVLGDVQSGKTATYTGLICKAADAGYKAIVILTGTIESLRVQTQKRLDLGFVGFDTHHMNNDNQEDHWIGVGKKNRSKKGIVLTSVDNDFLTNIAKNLGISLDSFNDTVLFVIKKNTTVLNRLIKWLKDLNGDNEGLINYPLLVIDDEADNASVNTKDIDDDPSRINGLIRNLLALFRNNSYVGFTATPFANIFINPFEEKDLFPKDFIYSLKSPSTYIGAQKIFYKDSKYRTALKTNDDCNEVLPANHKKHVPFNQIPSTLEDSILSYFITNVIRDLRGDYKEHRAMLINISRFVSMHETILDTVSSYVADVLRKYGLYCKDIELANKDSIIIKTKKVWEANYSHLSESWEDIMPKLYESNNRIQTLVVNKDSAMINYDEYKENGARIIVIGGLALSRGLTIEGLCISYFYRYSKTYDVLLQMGRWFGYRKNYDDLFRIWMPAELMDWYESITEAVDELKIDLERMHDLKQKPIDFGLRIKNDKTKLKITASNKMRTASDQTETVSLYGDFVDTPIIEKNVSVARENFATVESFINAIRNSGIQDEITENFNKRLFWGNVKKELILEFIHNFKISQLNKDFDKEGIINFIKNNDSYYFDEFDVVIVEGDRRSGKKISLCGKEITLSSKQFDVVGDIIRANKARQRLVNPSDTKDGLRSVRECERLIEDYKKYAHRMDPSRDPSKIATSAKTFLKTTNRNPLLMIYILDLAIHNDDENKEDLLIVKNYFDDNKAYPIGIALGIPKYYDIETTRANYKINMIAQRELMQEDFEEDL